LYKKQPPLAVTPKHWPYQWVISSFKTISTSKKCPSIKNGWNEPQIYNVNETSTALCGISEEEVENLGAPDDSFIPNSSS
jgi:hypothetical protein